MRRHLRRRDNSRRNVIIYSRYERRGRDVNRFWWTSGFFACSILFMEIVYHIACYGFKLLNPLFAIPVCLFMAGLGTLFTGFGKNKVNRTVFWGLLVGDFLLYASQLVYMKIFKQPLLIAAITNAGKAALTNYWREALTGILHALGWLILLAVPFVAAKFLLMNKTELRGLNAKERIWSGAAAAGGLLLFIAVLLIGHAADSEYSEAYGDFYDPEGVISTYGVAPSVLRDMCGDAFPHGGGDLEVWQDMAYAPKEPQKAPEETPDGETGTDPGALATPEPNKIDTSPNVLPIDFDSLIANADSDDIVKLAEYMRSMPPTNRNEYTGMFEGYNLIYLTAEGFSPYAVDETLTPTLYNLIHSGFVFEDYYVPLWQTSTSDGEYVNCTGLIPDQQFSMKRSAEDDMVFSLPAFFSLEGVQSYAFHNNSLSYYDRHRSHPNLGYNFMASKLGDLNENTWGGQVFEMEHAKYWPASDLDMMRATIPYYINNERFHVYYMTISGHMNYNFAGNKMSSIHREDVADLPYSDEGRAYVACNIELDRALEYLIDELKKAGKLEKTVICLSADHYPYAMEIENLEELAGKPLEGTLELYRNNLILWNSEMETVTVEKTASSLDILPTLLNLFGFEYDSRLYVGRDILSDSVPLVVFSDRSFITDRVSYHKKSKTIIWKDGYEEDEEYYEAVRKQVKGLYNYSAGILNYNFYRYVEAALPEQYHSQVDPAWTAPKPPPPPISLADILPSGGDGTDAPSDGGSGEGSASGMPGEVLPAPDIPDPSILIPEVNVPDFLKPGGSESDSSEAGDYEID